MKTKLRFPASDGLTSPALVHCFPLGQTAALPMPISGGNLSVASQSSGGCRLNALTLPDELTGASSREKAECLRIGAEIVIPFDFLDFSRVIWEIRLLKSGEEIACLRRAGEIADAALMAAVEAAADGVSERECAAVFCAAALKAGADNGRNLLLAGGKRSGSLHGRLGAITGSRPATSCASNRSRFTAAMAPGSCARP